MTVKKKACRGCKLFVTGSECPLCKTKDFTTNWEGRIIITDSNKSEIAKKIEIKVKGEYAIKVR